MHWVNMHGVNEHGVNEQEINMHKVMDCFVALAPRKDIDLYVFDIKQIHIYPSPAQKKGILIQNPMVVFFLQLCLSYPSVLLV